MKKFNEHINEGNHHRSNSKAFYGAIMNGWLFNIQRSVDQVFEEVKQLIYSRENSTHFDGLFHADEVKKFVEETTSHGVEIIIGNPTVAADVEIRLNLNFEEMSESEYAELVKNTQNRR